MFDYICVLDFEATCDNQPNFSPVHEVIEFPSVLLKWNGERYEEVSRIQLFCKPKVNVILTPFCTELTGITQEQVNAGIPFPEALKRHQNWLFEQIFGSMVFVTCGEWDLATMMPAECHRWNIPMPKMYRKYINVKDAFEKVTGMKKMGMMGMLRTCGLTIEGRQHSGIDDCHNIGRLVQNFTEKGFVWDEERVE